MNTEKNTFASLILKTSGYDLSTKPEQEIKFPAFLIDDKFGKLCVTSTYDEVKKLFESYDDTTTNRLAYASLLIKIKEEYPVDDLTETNSQMYNALKNDIVHFFVLKCLVNGSKLPTDSDCEMIQLMCG